MTNSWPRSSRRSSRGWCATGRWRARRRPQQAAAYLKSFYQGRRIVAFVARPELKGRFGYTADATRLDFQSDRGLLDEYLDRVLAHLDDDEAPSIYIGSTDVDSYLPGFRAENDLVLEPRHVRGESADGRCLDRQSHHGARASRHVEQHRLLHGRAAALHAVSARAGRESVSRARSSRRPAGRSSPWSTSARRISSASRDCARRSRRRRWPSWSRATRCSTRRCGGTRSRRSTSST